MGIDGCFGPLIFRNSLIRLGYDLGQFFPAEPVGEVLGKFVQLMSFGRFLGNPQGLGVSDLPTTSSRYSR